MRVPDEHLGSLGRGARGVRVPGEHLESLGRRARGVRVPGEQSESSKDCACPLASIHTRRGTGMGFSTLTSGVSD